MKSESISLCKSFSVIYVERAVLEHPNTALILSRFPRACVITIEHYKDIFNRSRQNAAVQSASKALILAQNKGKLIYEGAPVCQDFGYKNFCYCTSVMNCIFDCDYCFLKGMYSTSNIVIFVNIEDYGREALNIAADKETYLCVSYDSDISAMTGIIDYETYWAELASHNENLTVELRTKGIPVSSVSSERVIYAFTISPEIIIDRFEKHTPGLNARLQAANCLIDSGCRVRLCFDPMIYITDWRVAYEKMYAAVRSSLPLDKIKDVSIGTFRISRDYLRNLRRAVPDSEAVLYPFEVCDGYCCYPPDIRNKMTEYMKELVRGDFDDERIFTF